MARRKIKKEIQPVGYVLIADGETEQWYVELMKKHYNIRVKLIYISFIFNRKYVISNGSWNNTRIN